MASRYVLSGPSGGQYHFVLKASNGETILTSEFYTTKAEARNGIKAVKTNSATYACYVRNNATNGRLMFNLKAANGEIIGTSEIYSSEAARETGIESVMTNGPTAPVDNQTTG